jgi:hypothetical protein
MASIALKRGICYFKMADYQMAAIDFNFVVELDGTNVATALNWLGKIGVFLVPTKFQGKGLNSFLDFDVFPL